jgi:fucokinase
VESSPIEIVVTAAREAQARGYRAFLADRAARGDLPARARWHVVTDPGGRRAGSGAATALALATVWNGGRTPARSASRSTSRIVGGFVGRRILIVHSGGDSRRLPACAALGKAFAPLPARRPSGAPAAVFDLVLADLLALPPREDGEILIASGDAIVGVGAERLVLGDEDAIGIAQRGDLARASRHGVFAIERDGALRDFLQKPTIAAMRSARAIARDGRALIDTGIVRLSPRAGERLLEAFGAPRGRIGRGLLREVVRGRARAIDLYEHVMIAFVPRLSRSAYLTRVGVGVNDADADAIAALHAKLAGLAMRVAVSETDGFLHIGTTAECLDLLAGASVASRQTAQRYGLQPATGAPRLLHAARLTIDCDSASRVAVIGSLGARLTLAGDNLVVGMPPQSAPINLPRGYGCVALPIGRSSWATLLFHEGDDAKAPLSADPRIAGMRVTDLRARLGWRSLDATATVWDLPLWSVTRRPSIESWMLDGSRPSRGGSRKGARRSLVWLLERVNHARIVALDAAIAQARRADDPVGALRDSDQLGAAEFAAGLSAKERKAIILRLSKNDDHADASSPLERARCLAVAGRLASGAAGAALRRRALAAVGETLEAEVIALRTPPRAVIRPDETVWTSAPARVDLAGGWSDTPPICQERGGAVVNLAIDLDHRPPVHAIAKLGEEPVIAIHSVDLGLQRIIRRSEELFDHRDPRDWTALAKAALRISGIAPPTPSVPLRRWLERFGGGLSLAMLAAVPKGSGLGTSSILGATVLACLDRVTGAQVESGELVARTSLLEQMIATRGGWQDQLGGLEAGLKICRSDRGLDQHPVVERIPLDPAFERELNERTVLCYTGRRRMARDILERVVDRYLVRDPGVLAIVDELKENAERLRDAALAGDIDRFADEVNRYWRLKVTLDPLATTPEIESMAGRFRSSMSAWLLPGAGAGGFLFMIARSARHAERIRAAFVADPPNALARPVAWGIARHGLRAGSV